MERTLGALPIRDGLWRIRVWAPVAERVEVVLGGGRAETMAPERNGHHTVEVDGVGHGDPYRFRLPGGRELPDPASRHQPGGVHAASATVDPGAFAWTDQAWRGPALADYVIYELHVGTFTDEGTFDGAVPHLPALRGLGVTAVELMPVAQFPGGRNWGYDGVYPFAAQSSYGGPDGLKRLVDAAHGAGLAVILDVVYNHLGPEGNYTREFGPYFTERYRTPWGAALNFDGPGSDEVRRFFCENALQWLDEFHVDALRLDAVHSILDLSATTFLEDLVDMVERLRDRRGARRYLIAESDRNDARVITERRLGGIGMDAQWADDFHHAVHAALTGERDGYYADFGSLRQVGRALRSGFVFQGQRSAYRGRRHGSPATGLPAERFVVCAQNHDQIGNRLLGERLASLVSFERLKLAAGLVLLSPFVPLLFMGEEYGETAPFQYFISHTDRELVEAVRRGRAEEFAAFRWTREPPDPQAEDTFTAARLRRELSAAEPNRGLRALYRTLLQARREVPALARPSRDDLEVVVDEARGMLTLHRWDGGSHALAAFHLGEGTGRVLEPAGMRWAKRIDSSAGPWGGPDEVAAGTLDPGGETEAGPDAFVLYVAEVR